MPGVDDILRLIEESRAHAEAPLNTNISRGIDAEHPLMDSAGSSGEKAPFMEIAGKILQKTG